MEELKKINSIKKALTELYKFRGQNEDVFCKEGKQLLGDFVRNRLRKITAYELNKQDIFKYIFQASYYKYNGIMQVVMDDLEITERSFYRYKKEYIK
jgi:hypothetical protein